MDAVVDLTEKRRAEIIVALNAIGVSATAVHIYSCCPSFESETEVRRELYEMSKRGLVRVVSEVAPARYALPGPAAAIAAPHEDAVVTHGRKRAAPAKVAPAGAPFPAPRNGALEVWLSGSGALRIEKAGQVLDLSQRETAELRSFLVDLTRRRAG